MGTVCQACGDEGFVEALVYCDSCKIGAVHRYCCGITPVPIDDYVTWFCSDCEESDPGFDCKEVDQLSILTKSEKKKKKKKKNKKNKKKEENSNHTPPGLDVDHQDSSNVGSAEVSSAPPRALPIFKPIWRGSISVKHGNICSVDGLVAHLSSLACHKVHEKASSFHACLAAEMFSRLEIWPESFLKNGPPTDESVALYFFPSCDSNDKKVYYSLVDEMKKNDLAMRCVLDNVEFLLFTSYQLPMDCWKFHSKEYLWGIFRHRKTSRH